MILIAEAFAVVLTLMPSFPINEPSNPKTPLLQLPIGVSGIARFDEHALVVVHDLKGMAPPDARKYPKGLKEQGGSRVGIIQIADGCNRYVPLNPPKWLNDAAPGDVEAICLINENAGPQQRDYLLCESRGVLHHVRITHAAEEWRIEQITRIEIESEEKLKDIESAVCTAHDRNPCRLLLATRGEGRPVRAYWVDVNLSNGTAEVVASTKLPEPKLPWSADVRNCSDMAVDDAGAVWCVATRDPGKNGGYQSAIYRVQGLSPASPPEKKSDLTVSVVQPIPGHKVEGLCHNGGRRFVVGSDDENLGGAVWSIELTGF